MTTASCIAPENVRGPLAPDEALPEGWAWARVSEVTENVPNVKPATEPNRVFGYVDISSISNETFHITAAKRFRGKDAPSRARRPIRVGDVLFSNVRTYLRNVALVPDDLDAQLCSTGFTVLHSNRAIEPALLFYQVLTDRFIELVTPQQTGSQYPATSDRVVMAAPIPLPPLAEQKRIVGKVEQLLARVNAARERLARIPTILKRFRQAVLAAACSGRLTTGWRDTHPAIPPATDRWNLGTLSPIETDGLPDLPETWAWLRLKDISERVSVGHVGPTSEHYCPKEVGVPFVRSQNVRPARLDFADIQYITPRFHQTLKKSQLRAGDLLVVRVGANRGDVCVVPQDAVGPLNCANIVFARPYEGVSNYLELFCQGRTGQDLLLGMTTGSAQGVLNTKSVAELPIPVPPTQEQEEIANRIAALFKLADAIEKRVAAATARAEKLTHAILAKAFRGELVPTEAELARREGRSYEPASVLLDRIRATRDQSPVRRSRPRNLAFE